MVGRSGLYEGVKNGVREYCLRVTEMNVSNKVGVDMEFLYFIEVCSFLWQCIISMILFMRPNTLLPSNKIKLC